MDDAKNQILEAVTDGSNLKQRRRWEVIQRMDQDLGAVSTWKVDTVGHRPRLEVQRGLYHQWQDEVLGALP